MHGICLNYMMGLPSRNKAAEMAKKRPLELVEKSNLIDSDDVWKRHDVLTQQENMQMGIYQIYYAEKNEFNKNL